MYNEQLMLFKSTKFSTSFGYENFVMVVPTINRSSFTLFKSIVESPLFCVWALTICIFALARKGLRLLDGNNSAKSSLFALFFDTFAIIFGSASDSSIVKKPEKVLLVFVMIFSMLADILCSSMLFKVITLSHQINEINSLSEVELSGKEFIISTLDSELLKNLNER